MGDTGRIVATTIIWVTLVILLGGLFTTQVGAIADANSAAVVGVAVVLSVMALLITGVIWLSAILGIGATRRDPALRGKRKRLQGDRVARLLDELSDEEVYELEALLLHEARAERESATRRGSE
ncbi:MAG: hypothetical protein HRF48_17100 [Chloroflexota bacterium]|jgi:Na+-transporting methylmalonyl-CoA/oxaloacetate decarboxylase gamma subunit